MLRHEDGADGVGEHGVDEVLRFQRQWGVISGGLHD